MSVGEFCNREVVIAGRETGLREAARLMRRHHVGALVIVDDSPEGPRPVGVVTDRDLVVEVLAPGVDLEAFTCGDLVGPDVLTAREEDGIWETLQRMRARGVRRVPVVDRDGVLVGIITVDDLLELLAGELSDLVRVVTREIQRERATRA